MVGITQSNLRDGLLQSLQPHELLEPDWHQSSANFGKITSTVGSATATAVGTTAGVVGGGPRVIQLSLRFGF